MSDESQAMEFAGFQVLAVHRERSNVKITFAEDLAYDIEKS